MVYAQPALRGGGDTKTRPQKARRMMQHPRSTSETYFRKHMKHLKYGSQTLAKKHMKTLEKAIENIYNIQIKYLQHMCKIYATSK
jgi:hypothetical protein